MVKKKIIPANTKKLSPGSGIQKLLVRGVSMALSLCALAMVPPRLSAADPQVTNVSAHQKFDLNPLARSVEITYDLADPDSATVTVTLEVSSDGGQTWAVPATTLKGTGILPAVKPGKGLTIDWNAPADWPGQYSTQMKFRVRASDGVALVAAVLISPGGVTGSKYPTFVWNPVSGADSYRIIITRNSQTVVDSTVTETSFTPTLPLPNATYYWSITAASQGQYGPASVARRLIVFYQIVIEI
jgi:hypothetical protein